MKKLDLIFLKVFLYGLPVVALLSVFTYFYSKGVISHDGAGMGLLNSFAGLIFAVWIVLSIYLSTRLILSGPFRDKVIARITFVRERDEREATLTGKATRTVFLTSLAVLILLFCLCCFQVSIYRVPPEQAVGGKTGMVTLGLSFDLLEHRSISHPENTAQRQDIFSYNGLPLSSSAIILMLILWQVISYNYSMRRLMK